VLNVVSGFGETCGAPLAAHSQVNKVAFTGSTEVGKLIVKAAANDLKKVTLELGGKSPNIVLDDADLDAAIAGASSAIFFNHGQCCCAGSRLFVQEKRYDRVLEGVSNAAKKIRLGPGLDPATEMGPLVSKVQLERVTGFLQSGKEEGARTVTGGGRHGKAGYCVEPTVPDGTRETMRVYQEEIFGPVVTVQPFKEIDDELIRRTNDTLYGLAAGIWTGNLQRAHRIANQLRAGTVWINCYNIFDAALPFGGYKQSGWGREMGHEVLNSYLETQGRLHEYLRDVRAQPDHSVRSAARLRLHHQPIRMACQVRPEAQGLRPRHRAGRIHRHPGAHRWALRARPGDRRRRPVGAG
jgi:phenylacetaldehyde dehydrogenase